MALSPAHPASLDVARTRRSGHDLIYVTVDITDNAGLLAPRASNLVRFSLQGPGEIIATDNGNPISFESFQAPQRKGFNGRAVVIVRGRVGQAGSLVLRAESDGLTSKDVTPHEHEALSETSDYDQLSPFVIASPAWRARQSI